MQVVRIVNTLYTVYSSGLTCVRLYYAGGNGPHNGARNTSLGLATFRPDGLLSVSGTGEATTILILCTGAHLIVTADLAESTGSVAVGLLGGKAGLGIGNAVPITASSTDTPVVFKGGATFASLVGKQVQLTFKLSGAAVFTYGFTA
jgi:hypothetical protein